MLAHAGLVHSHTTPLKYCHGLADALHLLASEIDQTPTPHKDFLRKGHHMMVVLTTFSALHAFGETFIVA